MLKGLIDDKLFYLKHILSSEWLQAKCISEDDTTLTLLLEGPDSIYFEKDDKVLFNIKSKNNSYTFNSVVLDIDFPTYNKITIIIKKPLERRKSSRYNVSFSGNINNKGMDYSCTVVDISLHGIKVLSDASFSIKDKITLTTTIGDSESLECICSVIYKGYNDDYNTKTIHSYGLRIYHITPDNRRIINELIDSLK